MVHMKKGFNSSLDKGVFVALLTNLVRVRQTNMKL